jgi:hypothetical protein
MSDDTHVDDQAVSRLGDQFAGWATDIGNAADSVKDLSVNPGNFTDANNLKDAVKNRGNSLNTNLNNLKKACNDMSDSLHAAAKDYQGTEGENAAKAEFTKLDGNLKTDLPGIDDQSSSSSSGSGSTPS